MEESHKANIDRHISQTGIDLIKQYEGCKLKAYQDSAKIWTIGFGTTKGITRGMVITPEEAEDLFRGDLIFSEDCIKRLVKVELTQNEFDALVSWTYNLGCGSLRRSTMLKHINRQEHKMLVTLEMKKWNKAKGRVLKGLTRRREAEAKLFLEQTEQAEAR